MFKSKTILFIFFALLSLLPASAFAQSNATPTVSIELSNANPQKGEIITADVYIRNGVNIAGADIEITLDECLVLQTRRQGRYLPDASSGGFTVYDSNDDHSSRLAVAITDRNAVANEDGIFFQAEMEVVCDEAVGAVTISVAELSAYVDPNAAQIELIAYLMDDGTLATRNAQIGMGDTGVEVVDVVEEEPAVEQPTEVAEVETIEPVVEEPTPIGEDVTPVEEENIDETADDLETMDTQTMLMIASGAFALIFLGIALALVRRLRRRN